MATLSWGASADRSTEDAQVVAAGDLPLLGGEAAAQHRGDKLHPPRVVLDATPRIELVGAGGSHGALTRGDIGPGETMSLAWSLRRIRGDRWPSADRAMPSDGVCGAGCPLCRRNHQNRQAL